MDKLKFFLILLLGVTLGTAFLSTASAQDVDVLVTPDEAEVDLGEGLQLETFAFALSGDSRTPAAIDEINWEVEPDSMGTITDDGFFIAGRHFGEAVIRVVIRIGDRTIVREIVIRIGKHPTPMFRVIVLPEEAVVPTGATKQFKVFVVSHDFEREISPQFVRWEVKPEDLGKVNDAGIFQAGEHDGRGKVIAYVEFDGLRLRGEAHVIVSPAATGAIAGNVFSDTENLPLQDAVVRAVRLGGIRWIRNAVTDAQGNYLIEKLIPGVYVLTAHARGFIGEFYDDTRNYLEATPLNIAEEDTVTDKNFGLSEGAKIAGTIYTESDSSELAGAHVVAFLVVNPRFARHVVTGEDGSYLIESLPTGSYAVYANVSGYKGEYFDDSPEFSGATFVEVGEPNTTDGIDFALATSSAITGRVTSEVDGSPIAGAHIRAYGALNSVGLHPDRDIVKETRTNENGEYILQIRPGAYIVKASAEGFNSEFYDGFRDVAFATPVVVAADSHSTGIDFSLIPRSTISGTVTDGSTGEPIPGAVVEAFKEDVHFDAALTDAGFRAKADSSGNYTIENVPAGKYYVVANAERYLPEFWQEAATKQDATPVVVEENSAVDGIDFTLVTGGSISGLVASSVDSLPISRALVRVFDSNTGRHRRTYTNEQGAYKVGGLPSGSYLVQVIAEGFFPEFYEDASHPGDATPVEVTAPDDTVGINVYLEPQVDLRGTMAGRVVSDRDEAPIEGAVIIAVSPTLRQPHITFTGPNGFYRLTDLPAGRYFVFAWAEGFVGEFYRDAFRFANADPVIIGSDQVTAGISFGLRPTDRHGIYAVRGRIRSANTNTPVEGVMVHARLDGGVEVSAVTDANGVYILADLPAGEYKIEATAPGYADGYFGGTSEESAMTVVVGNGQDAESVDIDVEEDNVTSVGDDAGAAVPERFGLQQNYPNPFNPETTIKYQLSEASRVTLRIFNILGQEVRTLVDDAQQAGVYSVQWNGKDAFGRQASSGIYIFQLEAGDNFRLSRRMLLLK